MPPSLTTTKWLLSLSEGLQTLLQEEVKDHKPCSKRVCNLCGKSDHYIAKCPYTSDSDRDDDKKGKKKMEKKKYYNKKKGGEAHIGQEWDFDESSNEDAANIAINNGLLFPHIGHKCLMAKDSKKKKVHSRDTPSILLSMMRVALVKTMMIFLLFLRTLP
jgi:hypothetical protein